jgi:predicted metal-dependent hydrolase
MKKLMKLPMKFFSVSSVSSLFRTRNRRLYLAHKESARALVSARIKHFMNYYGPTHGIVIKRVAIKNHKSRWGSCSKNGNLNFNYKILFLPPQLSDYVIVHEICHLKEFSHARSFWNLVGETIPSYKELRKQLKNVQ